MRLRILAGLALLGLLFNTSFADTRKRASVNVPLHHWTYDALEHLVSRGTIPGALVHQKPLTREQVGRIIFEATFDPSQEENPSPYLEKLKQEYDYEFSQWEEDYRIGGVLKRPRVRFRPVDPLRVEPSFAILDDGDGVEPRENHRGDDFGDILNLQIDLRSTFLWNPFLAVESTPKLLSREGDTEAFFERLYAKFTFRNLDLEIGRDSIGWGPGYHGSLLFTDNAPPFDLLKLSNAQPFQLPWVFRPIGYFHISAFLTKLGDNRVIPHPKLFGLRVAWSPFTFFELALNRAIMFDGEGRPNLDFGEFLNALYGFNENPPGQETNPDTNTNQLASLDFVLTLPWLSRLLPVVDGIKLYWEYGGEDEERQNLFPGVKFPAPSATANLLGGFLSLGRADLRIEYLNNTDDVAVWYTHSLFQSGYTYRGDVIGHHAGGDAEDLFIRGSTLLTQKWEVGLQYDREKHGIERQTSIERKEEWGGDVTFFYSDDLLLKGSYELERFENKENVPGKDETNHYLIFELQKSF